MRILLSSGKLTARTEQTVQAQFESHFPGAIDLRVEDVQVPETNAKLDTLGKDGYGQ